MVTHRSVRLRGKAEARPWRNPYPYDRRSRIASMVVVLSAAGGDAVANRSRYRVVFGMPATCLHRNPRWGMLPGSMGCRRRSQKKQSQSKAERSGHCNNNVADEDSSSKAQAARAETPAASR